MSVPEAELPSRAKSFGYVFLAYVVAFLAAVVVRQQTTELSATASAASAYFTSIAVIFAFSRIANNSSVFDPYWSVAPPLLALDQYLRTPDAAEPTRRAAIVLLVLVWGARLTWNWARGWDGLGHEDWRYRDLREKSGVLFWLVSFLGIHLFPGVLVFLGCLPLRTALANGTQALGWLDLFATVVTAAAITIETIADQQLFLFVARRSAPGELLREGLWRYSRHPNYFGEVSFWWGLYFFGVAAAPKEWLSLLAGPAPILALFVFISIPMLDQRSLKRRPGYEEHMKKTSALLPLPPKE